MGANSCLEWTRNRGNRRKVCGRGRTCVEPNTELVHNASHLESMYLNIFVGMLNLTNPCNGLACCGIGHVGLRN